MSSSIEQDAWIARLKLTALTAGFLTLLLGAWAYFGPGLKPEALPIYGKVPAFELTGIDGKPFSSHALLGKAYVASFVFTTCTNSCPMLTVQMKRLAKMMPAGEAYALISITVDPVKDSPAVLAAYAKNLGVEDPRWHFLTGKKAAIKSLVEGGYKLSAQVSEPVPDERGVPDILHSSKLVLVDGQGQIRGYYDGLLGSSVGSIKEHLKRLAHE